MQIIPKRHIFSILAFQSTYLYCYANRKTGFRYLYFFFDPKFKCKDHWRAVIKIMDGIIFCIIKDLFTAKFNVRHLTITHNPVKTMLHMVPQCNIKYLLSLCFVLWAINNDQMTRCNCSKRGQYTTKCREEKMCFRLVTVMPSAIV